MNIFDQIKENIKSAEVQVQLSLNDNLIQVADEIVNFKKILKTYVELAIISLHRENPEVKTKLLIAIDLLERYNELELRMIELGNPESSSYHEVEDESTERMFLIKLGIFSEDLEALKESFVKCLMG